MGASSVLCASLLWAYMYRSTSILASLVREFYVACAFTADLYM